MLPVKPSAKIIATEKKPGKELAEFTGKACADVVDRTAGNVALVVRGLVLLRENRLAVDGGHAEECTQPHPENRARAAGIQCGSRACEVAGADLRRDRGGQRLERTHAVLARLLTVERANGRTDASQPAPNLRT